MKAINTETNLINIAVIQQKAPHRAAFDTLFNELERNIKNAAKKGANLIILPELHNSPYFCQTEDPKQFDRAEIIPGPSTEKFSIIAKKNNVVLVTSLFEKRQPGIYHNTAVVFEKDGSIAGKYRKMHIPDDPGYYEKYYFTPGDLGFTPIDTSVGRLGVLICWDQWFPEAARLMALAGADIILYPTAIGWDLSDDKEEKKRQHDAWITVQRGHAIANGIPLAVCNRVGTEFENDSNLNLDLNFKRNSSKDSENNTKSSQGEIAFWGSSFIAGPQGEILAQASAEQPDIIYASIDKAHTESVRRIWPFFRDRRIDSYEGLLKRGVE